MTLLLTVVAFKQVIGQSLPRLPYITYLDRYALVSLALIILIGVIASALSTAAVCVDAPLRRPTLCTSVLPSLDFVFVDHADYVSLVTVATLWIVYQIVELFFIVRARRIEKKGAELAAVEREKHHHHEQPQKATEMAAVETKSDSTPMP